MKAYNVRFRGHYTVPYAQRAKRGFCGVKACIAAKLPVAAAKGKRAWLWPAARRNKGQPPGTKVQEAVFLRDTPVRRPPCLHERGIAETG